MNEFERFLTGIFDDKGDGCGKIDKSNVLACYCNEIDDFGDIKIFIENNEYLLKARHYVYESSFRGKKICVFRINSLSTFDFNEPVMILGAPFFSAFYVQFDLDGKRVGIIPKE